MVDAAPDDRVILVAGSFPVPNRPRKRPVHQDHRGGDHRGGGDRGGDDRGGVRDRLLAVATRLFAAQGYEATSVQQVATEAGVTKGAFYYYFAAKDDLLLEIYHRLLGLQDARLEAYLGAAGPADQRLHAAAVDVVLSSWEHLDAFVVFVRSVHLLDPEHQAAVRARRRAYHHRFRALVEQGQAEGSLRGDIAADVAVHAFLGGAHRIPDWFRSSGPLTIEQVAAQFADLLVCGLSPPGGRRS